MFERVMYLASEKQNEKDFVMALARQHGSAVLMTAFMRRPSKPPKASCADAQHEDEERRCWEALYALEQEFKASGIKSSLVVQEGDLDNLLTLVTSTHCDLIVLAAGALTDRDYKIPEELLANLPCPLIITQPG